MIGIFLTFGAIFFLVATLWVLHYFYKDWIIWKAIKEHDELCLDGECHLHE